MVQRYGMLIRLRPERREEYLRLHAAVWPGVERTLREANIRNFTIFRHDDLLFGYYEYVGEDHDADQARIAADPETQRWWALTDPCQESLSPREGGAWWTPMDEVWHLAPGAAGSSPVDGREP
ncbi:L-rhamnose mutarotase [Amycolatopsis sp. NPDC058278]|jgi:L-rhamnose mutarotase|uniref:L-rhamnose mutarotase n=1 Tax=unclassified Amycolatopsis TaxID=2618356 RepID=UPI00255B7FCD|nr:L-rhamnose mutarotase [Amycolatopsis sp. DG1A-15b]WIX90492.1 L-rhamnose mutarotase [Amycolatopsis sp. DG1A-15b]